MKNHCYDQNDIPMLCIRILIHIDQELNNLTSTGNGVSSEGGSQLPPGQKI